MSPEDRSTLVRIMSTEAVRSVGVAAADAQAKINERLARAELLTILMEALRPGLRQICGRVPIAGRRIAGEEQTNAAAWRGVLVMGQPPAERLYVDSEGWFVLVTVLEVEDGWRSEQTRLSPVQIVDRYEIALLITSLALAVEMSNTAIDRAADAARSRAERLRALAKLVSA